MKKKTLMIGAGILFLALMVSTSNAYAFGWFGHCHKKAGHSENAEHAEHGMKGKGMGDMDQMFFMKAHCILENQTELGLAKDKADAIKNLKLETKKALIKQGADIEVTELDLTAKLQEYPVNVDEADKLVDQKFDLKKAKTKTLIDAMAKLKANLTKDQYDKFEELMMNKKEGGKKSRHHKAESEEKEEMEENK